MATREEINQRINDEAQAVGLELIGPGKSTNYRMYRFKSCGHEQEIARNAVKNSNFKCKECYTLRLKYEAQAVGLELIGPGKNHLYNTYRFKSCGHEQELIVGNVRDNKFSCKECHQIKLHNEANTAGLELIGNGKTRRYKLYKFSCCGTENEILVTNVRAKSFCCPNCTKTVWQRPSNLYAIIIEDNGLSWIKVGIAANIQTRIKAYKLNPAAKATTKFEVLFDTRYQSISVEKFLQSKRLKEYQLPPEQMKEYMGSGFTECYSMDAWPLVSKLFNEIITSR